MSENSEAAPAPEIQLPKKHWFTRVLTFLAIFGIGAVTLALILPAVFRPGVREAARRSQCKNNLKQIALALHNYELDYDVLPPAYTVDAYGHRLHSWRTLILPYLDHQALYHRIDLSKPWDDPANAEACKMELAIISCPSAAISANHTTYLASVGENACFLASMGRRLSDITDAHFETLMVIDVPPEQSVPWMSPNDADEALLLSIDADSNPAHSGGFQAAACDGSVRYYHSTMPAEARRALISIAAGDKVEDY